MKLSTRIKIWNVKRIAKRIAKFEKYKIKHKKSVDTLTKWITEEKQKIEKGIMAFDEDELLLYGQQIGEL